MSPAPKNPNVTRAHEERRKNAKRRRLEGYATELREAGWTVIPPEVPEPERS